MARAADDPYRLKFSGSGTRGGAIMSEPKELPAADGGKLGELCKHRNWR